MSSSENHVEQEAAVDPMEVIYIGECESLSGRSIIAYAVGRNKEDGALGIRITDSSGKGMWSSDWASASDIQDIVLGNTSLVGMSLNPLWQGRSVNTCSFALSALRDLGLVEVNPEQTRHHRHVSRMTFSQAVQDRIAEAKALSAKPSKRKANEG